MNKSFWFDLILYLFGEIIMNRLKFHTTLKINYIRMINIFRNIICPAVLMVCVSCAAGKKYSDPDYMVTPLAQTGGVPEGSLVYGLPLTVLDLTVVAERTIEKPGPYARYAEDMLGLRDIVKAENESWTIKGITINSHQELDPSEFYIIETGSLFRTNVLSLKESGLILDLNPELYNSVKALFPGNGADLMQQKVLDLGADEYFQEKRDTAYRIVNVDTAFIKIPYLVEKKQKLTIDQLADRAARRLLEMRDGKHMILTGEANVFPQNDAAINEMNRLEKEYTELFAGKTWTEKRTFNYQLIPRKENSGKQVMIFKFSATGGPVMASEKEGTPVMIEFMPEMKTKDLTVITKKHSGSSSTKNDKLFYRVPDVVNVRISAGNEILNTSRQLIYQFGNVIPLPSNFIIGK